MIYETEDLKILRTQWYPADDRIFINLKKEFKWLQYFCDSYDLHLSFIKKFNDQVIPQFESYIGKKIDWNKMWLFISPSSNIIPLFELYDKKEKYIFYALQCAFKSKVNEFEIECDILWKDELNKNKVDFTTDISALDVKFEFHRKYEYIQEDFDKMPTYIKSPIPQKYNFNLSYNVISYLDSIPHEAILSFKFSNKPDIETIQKILGQAQNEWNEISDNSKIESNVKNGNGFLHNIYYSHKEEDEYYFYLDHGTANSNVLEFLLKKLDENNFSIIQVEIESV